MSGPWGWGMGCCYRVQRSSAVLPLWSPYARCHAVNDREMSSIHNIVKNNWCTKKDTPCLAVEGEVWGIITECKSFPIIIVGVHILRCRESIVLMKIIDILYNWYTQERHCKIFTMRVKHGLVLTSTKTGPSFTIVLAWCAHHLVIYDHKMFRVYSVDENN